MENSIYSNVPADSLVLGDGQYYSKDCKKTQLNNNVMVIGASGAGKTRSIVRPNILQASGSYIISDPKGGLYEEMKPYLMSKGYTVNCMDFINIGESLRYDPLQHCKNTQDIHALAHTFVYEMSCSNGHSKNYDPFWDQTSEINLEAMMGYLFEDTMLTGEKHSIIEVVDYLHKANRKASNGARGKSELDEIMEEHRLRMLKKGKKSWAYEKYQDVNTAPDKTQATIVVCTLANISRFNSEECRKFMAANDIDFTSIGTEKTALFIKVSDTDRSMDMLVNLFYNQLMNELCSFADNCPDHSLPIPVTFILDDFATNARIDNMGRIISNIRSRNISAMLMCQSQAQLEYGYSEAESKVIVDNCNTFVYMGGTSAEQATLIAKRADKTLSTILNMPLSMSYIFRRGQKPLLCHNIDLEEFAKEKGYIPYNPCIKREIQEVKEAV